MNLWIAPVLWRFWWLASIAKAPEDSHLYLKIFVLDIFAVNLHSVRSDRGRED